MSTRLPLAVLFLAGAVFTASVYQESLLLPEQLATHFDGTGQANGWMSRRQHLIFITLLGGGMPLFVIGLCYLIRFLPASLLNVPNAAYWRATERYPEACRRILTWSFWFGAVSLIWTALLHQQIVEANRYNPAHLDNTMVLILAVGFVITTGILIAMLVQSFQKRRVRRRRYA